MLRKEDAYEEGAGGDLDFIQIATNTKPTKHGAASGPLQLLFLLHDSSPHFVQVSVQTLPLRNLSPDYSIKNNLPSSPSRLLMCFIFSLEINVYTHCVSFMK